MAYEAPHNPHSVNPYADEAAAGGSFMDKLRDMTPEQREQFLNALGMDYESAAILGDRDITRADALRRDLPQGRQAGGMFIAANPLEHLAVVLQNRKQAQAAAASREARDKALTDARDLRARVMRGML